MTQFLKLVVSSCQMNIRSSPQLKELFTVILKGPERLMKHLLRKKTCGRVEIGFLILNMTKLSQIFCYLHTISLIFVSSSYNEKVAL